MPWIRRTMGSETGVSQAINLGIPPVVLLNGKQDEKEPGQQPYWASWGVWSRCKKTCRQERRRQCVIDSTIRSGHGCPGIRIWDCIFKTNIFEHNFLALKCSNGIKQPAHTETFRSISLSGYPLETCFSSYFLLYPQNSTSG